MNTRTKRVTGRRGFQQPLSRFLLETAPAGVNEIPSLTWRQLASALGATRESVREAFNSLKRQGAIRMERGVTAINRPELERIARGVPGSRAYALLKTVGGKGEEATSIIRRQPGVLLADEVEGWANVVFALQGTDRQELAANLVSVMAAVEQITEDFRLFPAS